MFKSVNSILIAASVALLMFGLVLQANAQQVNAQRGNRNRNTNTHEFVLLRKPMVQEELELVDDQIEKIKKIDEDMRTSMREMVKSGRQKFSGMSNDERREAWSAIKDRIKVHYVQFMPEVDKVLLPNQVQRLAEIKMQTTIHRTGGLTSETGSEAVKDQLNITDEQLEAMKEKAIEVRKTLEAKYLKLRTEAEAEVLSVLDDEQRAKYNEMMGNTFDVEGMLKQTQRGARQQAGGQGDRGQVPSGGSDEAK